MKAPIIYKPDFCTNFADIFFNRLWNELAWIRHDKVPRREYYVNGHGTPYTYGTPPFERTYFSQPNHDVIEVIRGMVEQSLKDELGEEHVMDVCFLNGYENQSDQLGWHADDSAEMDDERPIAIVSLGVEREIYFRPNKNEIEKFIVNDANIHNHGSLPESDIEVLKKMYSEPEKLKLGHGSMCIMLPGMQDTHEHRIPKASFMCGERISLTFRGYVSQSKLQIAT